MHDLFQVLRTVAVMEVGCSPYLTYSQQVNAYVFPNSLNTHNCDPSKLAVINISDDSGHEEGDQESIHRMHRLIMSPNTLYDVVDQQCVNLHDERVGGCFYYYRYLVATENPEYLSDLINIAHAQSQVDKLTYKFNEKYDLTKKRKLDDTDF